MWNQICADNDAHVQSTFSSVFLPEPKWNLAIGISMCCVFCGFHVDWKGMGVSRIIVVQMWPDDKEQRFLLWFRSSVKPSDGAWALCTTNHFFEHKFCCCNGGSAYISGLLSICCRFNTAYRYPRFACALESCFQKCFVLRRCISASSVSAPWPVQGFERSSRHNDELGLSCLPGWVRLIETKPCGKKQRLPCPI